MISAHAIATSGAAANYHKETWERGVEGKQEYYVQENVPSAWGGEGAQHAGFGIGKEVGKEDFVAALDGKLANQDGTSAELGKWGKNAESGEKEWQHRAGMDFTFAPPKSVSMVGLIGKDERVVAAHEAAVARAMDYLEKTAGIARVTEGGQTAEKLTGNLLYARFSHETSRDLDPQIHTHTIIANATFDRDSGTWRSLSNEKLLENRTTADAIYNLSLAKDLKKIGYGLDFGKGGSFEIAGINREQIEKFSSRDTQIKAWLAERGIAYKDASHAQQEAATQATRKHKTDFDRKELSQEWGARATAAGLDIGGMVESARQRPTQKHDRYAEQASAVSAVDKAINHLSEREAVFDRKDLIRAAVNFTRGQTSGDQVEQAIDRAGQDGALIQKGEDRYTTPAAIGREKSMVHSMVRGRDALESGIMKSEKLDAKLGALDAERVERGGFQLNPGQRDAARMILTTRDRFVAVQGAAGTGKTTMLEAVRQIAESRGTEVIGMSAGAKQAAVLQADSGIKSQTIASFLIDARKQASVQPPAENKPSLSGIQKSLGKQGEALPAGARAEIAVILAKAARPGPTDAAKPGESSQRQIWVVDEASMTSQKDMSELMKHAETRNAQVVFVGDKQQHQSVESGKAFDQLQSAGILQADLTEVNRQRDEVGKASVNELLKGDTGAAYDKLEKIEIADNAALIDRMAKDYANSPERDQTIIVTATNADRQAINTAVRGELRELGVIRGEDHKTETLQPIDMTKAESSEAFRYKSGDVLRSNRDYKSMGIMKGDYLQVVKTDDTHNRLGVRNERTGQDLIFNPAGKTNFTPFRGRETGFAEGDQVRFTLNDKDSGISNGDTARVAKINGNKMTVIAGEGKAARSLVIDTKTYRHIEHGHATTSFGAQGATKEKAIYHINASSGAGVGDRSFYVGATRAREGTTVYTTDKNRARNLIDRSQNKTSAIDATKEASGFSEKLQKNGVSSASTKTTKQRASSGGSLIRSGKSQSEPGKAQSNGIKRGR